MSSRREFLISAAAATIAGTLPRIAMAAESRVLPTRAISGGDETLSIIGLGNSRAFRADDLTLASNLLDIYLSHGGGYVDVNGTSAFSVGKLGQQKDASEELFFGNYVDPKELSVMRQEVVALASAQGKKSLDLVHTRNLASFRAQHDNYMALKEDGLVRHIGIARSGSQNFAAMEKLVEDGLVDFVQVNYSLAEPQSAERLLPLAADYGVAVVINRPFINGNYFSIVQGHELPAWAAEFDCNSWAQFSLKFILAHPAVTCVLTETANPEHAVDNLGAGFGRLPDALEQEKMRVLFAEIRS